MQPEGNQENDPIVGGCIGCATSMAVLMAIGIVFVVGVAIYANSNSDDGAGSDETPVSGSLACGHFRNVLDDVRVGVLTDTEIREKFQEVERDALGSPVYQDALELVAAATQGPPERVRAAAERMDAACAGLGL